MACPVDVMLAFSAKRKTIKAASLTDFRNPLTPAGEQLVDVGLVAHIPHKLVFWGGEHLVHGNGELDHTKVWPQMTTGLGELGDQFRAHFSREIPQLSLRQFLDVRRFVDHVEISAHSLIRLLPKRHRARGQFPF